MEIPDPQQKRVYAWEEGWIDWRHGRRLTEAGVRKWVRWACKLYGVKPPKVRFHKNQMGGTSFYDPNTHVIEFRRRHMNVWCALHEAAHAITDTLLGPDRPAHGQHWMGVFRWLLAEALEASFKKTGIKAAPPGFVGPQAIRKRYKKAREAPRHR